MSRTVPYLSELQPEMFCEVSPELAAERGLEHGGWATIVTAAGGDRGARAGDRADRAARGGGPDRPPGRRALPLGFRGLAKGDAANDLFSIVLDPNVHIQEVKAASCDVRPGRRPRGPTLPASSPPTAIGPVRRSRRDGRRHPAPAWPSVEAEPRVGFFTDTSVCIGCKACEVACKEWNQVPEESDGLTGNSYDNSLDLGANRWRHVAFVEQRVEVRGVGSSAPDSWVEEASRQQLVEQGCQSTTVPTASAG